MPSPTSAALPPPLVLALAALLAAGVAAPASPQVPDPTAGGAAGVPAVEGVCAERGRRPPGPSPAGTVPAGPAPDLFCIELLPTASVGRGRGVVELAPASSPFGVAVDPAGRLQYDLTAWLDGLPDPQELGPYEVYVAWAATPVFSEVVKLGPVENGRIDLGRVGLNKFLLMVSAEPSVDVESREGRLVLRGRSPSSLMEAHDLLAQAPSALRAPEEGAGGMADSPWSMPPMYPGVPMLPGMMALEPEIQPLLPRPGGRPPSPAADSALLADLPLARPASIVELPDGGTLDLEAGFVRREIDGRSLVMLAFNGQHPGPILRVREAATITVNFHNATPMPTSVHWHGIRLDNRYDGVPGVTQEPVEPGESFQYRIHFPDPGIYWYHPHHREDVQQEMGLYGNLLVDPLAADHYGPVNREETLVLDDILLGEDDLVPFGRESSNYALMGRFGNRTLVNGEPEWEMEVARGEVVRFFLTNVANTRTFNVSFERRGTSDDSDPLPMKVVASDVSRFERETWARSAVISPAERYVVEVRFDEPGDYLLVNRVQGIDHRQGFYRPERRVLGTVRVSERAVEIDHAEAHAHLREHRAVVDEIDAYRDLFGAPPDHELVLSLEVSDLPAPIEQSMRYDWVYFNPVEWTGTMPMMNWVSTGGEVRWILRDADSGAENMRIDWRFEVGDVVKIRLHNDRNAFHAMQHPLHIHGQRFLVVSRNGVPNDNLVWKDTVLLPPGSTTDILLELSNPGRWMVHCHIAEHLESGMKFVMDVDPS